MWKHAQKARLKERLNNTPVAKTSNQSRSHATRASVIMTCFFAFFLVALICVTSVNAAGSASAASVAPRWNASWDASEAHGWFAMTDGRPGVNVSIFHMPPRGGLGSGQGAARASQDGTVRPAAVLRDLPLGIAAVGDEAFFAFEPMRLRPTQHRIVSIRAVPLGVGALWETRPNGRMDERPVLEAPGRLAGLAGTGEGVYALLIQDDVPTLMRLDVSPAAASASSASRGWKEVALPAEALTWRNAIAEANAAGVTEPAMELSAEVNKSATPKTVERSGIKAVTQPRSSYQPPVARKSLTPWVESPWRIVGSARWIGVLAWTQGSDGSPTWTLWRHEFVSEEVASNALVGGTKAQAASANTTAKVEKAVANVDAMALEWTRLDVSLARTSLESVREVANLARVRFGVNGPELIAMRLVARESNAPELVAEPGVVPDHGPLNCEIVIRRVDGPASWRKLTTIEAVAEPFEMVGLEGVGRLAFFWEAAAPKDLTGGVNASSARRTLGPPGWRIAEVSAISGESFYRGELKVPFATTSADYSMLGFVLMGILAGAMVFIVMPTRGEEVYLPAKTALAPPGRRFMATVADGFLGLIAASAAWGMSVNDAFGLEGVLTGRVIWIMVTAIVILIVVCGLMEAWIGRSPGKLLAGVEVVRMGKGKAKLGGLRGRAVLEELIVRPSVWMCLARNAVKWIMPPVAMLGLLDPSGRHRGDVLTRAAVVVRFEDTLADGK